MAKKTVNVFIGAKNKMKAGLRSSLKSLKRFNKKAKASLRSLGQTFRRVGLIAGTAFVGLVKFGNQFRTQMAQVNTMLDASSKTGITELTQQVRDLSAEFGLAKKTLADGLYQALSAGVPSENAIEFLTVASRAAVGGLTDVKTSVDGLTTVMNAYGIAADKATAVSDILFTVVKDGKINYEELSENIGKIAPFAKVAEVGIRDLGAMIATLVKVEKPERAMTALNQSLVFAAKNGKTLFQVLDDFKGFNLEQIMAAGVSQKAAKGIALMVANVSVLHKEMGRFKDTAGAADAAFKKVDAMRHWQKLWQSVLSATSRVGEMIDRTLSPAVNKLAERIRNFGKSEQFDKFIDKVKNATQEVMNLIRVLSGAEGADKIKAVLLSGGEIIRLSFISGAQDAVNIIAKGLEEAFKQSVKKSREKRIQKNLFRAFGLDPNMLKTAKAALKFTGVGQKDGNNNLINKGGTEKDFAEAFANLKKLTTPSKRNDMFDKAALSVLDMFKPAAKFAKGVFDTTAIRAEGSLTNTAGGVLGTRSVSADTSLLSTGALFTMMQTGGDAKDTVLSELQKQTILMEKSNEMQKEEGVS